MIKNCMESRGWLRCYQLYQGRSQLFRLLALCKCQIWKGLSFLRHFSSYTVKHYSIITEGYETCPCMSTLRHITRPNKSTQFCSFEFAFFCICRIMLSAPRSRYTSAFKHPNMAKVTIQLHHGMKRRNIPIAEPARMLATTRIFRFTFSPRLTSLLNL